MTGTVMDEMSWYLKIYLATVGTSDVVAVLIVGKKHTQKSVHEDRMLTYVAKRYVHLPLAVEKVGRPYNSSH